MFSYGGKHLALILWWIWHKRLTEMWNHSTFFHLRWLFYTFFFKLKIEVLHTVLTSGSAKFICAEFCRCYLTKSLWTMIPLSVVWHNYPLLFKRKKRLCVWKFCILCTWIIIMVTPSQKNVKCLWKDYSYPARNQLSYTQSVYIHNWRSVMPYLFNGIFYFVQYKTAF